jgi:hypothetical protein
MTALLKALASYLALRRSMGFTLGRDEKLLEQFISYLRPETAVICAGRPSRVGSDPLNIPVVLASRGQRHEYSRQPFRWLKSRPGCVLRGGPRDVIDREPGRGCNGRGRYPGEGLDVPVEVGLVGVAAVCCYQGGAVTRRRGGVLRGRNGPAGRRAWG